MLTQSMQMIAHPYMQLHAASKARFIFSVHNGQLYSIKIAFPEDTRRNHWQGKFFVKTYFLYMLLSINSFQLKCKIVLL